MKRTLLIVLLCALCFGAGYQSTSNFSVRWTFTGADAATVDDAEIRYLASAVMGSGVDADIYQHDANGNIELDNVGRRKIQKNKVRPAFRSMVAAKVQEWAEVGDIGELSAIQTQAVVNKVKAKPTPVVQ